MPTATYIPLQTITLGSSASTVTFANIPNTYRDLVIVVSTRSSLTSLDYGPYYVLNSDTGNNYSAVIVNANSSGFASYPGGTNNINTGNEINNSSGSSFQVIVTNLMDYSATDKHKTAISRTNGGNVGMTASRWANTSAVTSIRASLFSGSFVAGSTFSLYGIAG